MLYVCLVRVQGCWRNKAWGKADFLYYFIIWYIFIQVAQDVPCAPEILSAFSTYCSHFNKRYCFCWWLLWGNGPQVREFWLKLLPANTGISSLSVEEKKKRLKWWYKCLQQHQALVSLLGAVIPWGVVVWVRCALPSACMPWTCTVITIELLELEGTFVSHLVQPLVMNRDTYSSVRCSEPFLAWHWVSGWLGHHHLSGQQYFPIRH